MTTRLSCPLLCAVLLVAAAASAQTARTQPLMREKLHHAQQLLEALTTSNQRQLEREAGALAAIAQSPRWGELKTPELRTQADHFLDAVTSLQNAARARDFDAAARSYDAMIGACYQCHKHLKDSRIAR